MQPSTDSAPLADFPALQPRFTHGRGLRLIREDGLEFIDAASGTFNVPLGYDHPAITAAVIDQLQKCAHISSSYAAPYARAVLDELLSLAPPGIDAGWMRDLTGSTANECAIKLAQKATGRTDVISLFLSHHGQTQLTTAVSGNAFRRKSFPASQGPHSLKIPAPYCYRCTYRAKFPGCGFLCVEALREHVEFASSGNVACMIVEPILGNGGNIVPPPGYFAALSKLCRELDILLIADEVQTGLGRTGHLFACEALGLEANIISLAKGLGGIGIPVAAVLMESRLDVLEKHEHSFTSGSNMLALAAAQATLRVIQDESFLRQVRENGKLLGQLLEPLSAYACVGDIRGLGMMWALEIVKEDRSPDPEKTAAIIHCAEERHQLILRGSRYGFGNAIKVRPALISTPQDLEEITVKLSRAISDVEQGRG